MYPISAIECASCNLQSNLGNQRYRQSKISTSEKSSTWYNGISQANAPISLPVQCCHNILFTTLFPSFCNSLPPLDLLKQKFQYLCSPLNLSICPKLLWCSGQPSNFLGRWYQFPLAPHESLIPNIWTTVSQNVVQGPDNICPYFSMFTFHLAVLRKNFPGGYLDIPDIGGLDSLW